MLELIESGTIALASATAFSLSPAGLELQQQASAASGPDRAPPAGDLQPPRDDPPARGHRHERDDRGRHLRQRQLDPHHGLADPERHRRLRGLRPQRLHLDLRHAFHGQGRGDLRASCRWSRTWTTPSTTSRSSSPNRAWPTCVGWRPGGAPAIIDNCAHPDYRPLLEDYFDRALTGAAACTLPTCSGRPELARPVPGDGDDGAREHGGADVVDGGGRPTSPMVRSSSAMTFSTTCRTPFRAGERQPVEVRPPEGDASAPSASAMNTSAPVRMPLSKSSGGPGPTAARTASSASSAAIAWSTCRPPWLDTMMPSTPASTAPGRRRGAGSP